MNIAIFYFGFVCLMFLCGFAIGSFCTKKELTKDGPGNNSGNNDASVLDDIRTEIENYIDKEKLAFGGQFDSGLNAALKIIDKHVK